MKHKQARHNYNYLNGCKIQQNSITKCIGSFIKKWEGFSQNAYYKSYFDMQLFYCKMPPLLQKASVHPFTLRLYRSYSNIHWRDFITIHGEWQPLNSRRVNMQPRPQGNFKEYSPGTAWFRGREVFSWFDCNCNLIVSCKSVKINLCNAANFP